LLLSPRRSGRLLDGDLRDCVLLVATADPGSATALERARDELLERVAVPLLERRPLRLAVIGEDDHVVGTRRVPAGGEHAADLLVELAQRLERVGPLEPGVV